MKNVEGYNNSLEKDISSSQKNSNFLNNMAAWLLTFSLISIGGLAISTVIAHCNNILLLYGIAGVLGVSTAVAIVDTAVRKHKKKKSTINMEFLVDALGEEEINLTIDDIKKSLVTEEKKKVVSTNRKYESSNLEEIIKRYYMLDKDKQIQVLQQTFRKIKNDNGEKIEEMQFQLLEDKDLKNIELPEVVVTKRLVFNERQKKDVK